MISKQEINNIQEFHSSGHSVLQIAKILNRSVPSIYKYVKLIINNPNLLAEKKKRDIPHKIESFVKIIDQQLKNNVFNNTRIYKELQERGYKGSYGLLNSYLQHKRDEKNSLSIRAYQKVETDPGDQAQVDWGHFGKIEVNGMWVNLYVFVYVLSYSRAMHAEFVTSQRQQIFQQCHMNAFEKLGVPKKIRYDNVKTVVNSREKLFGGDERITYNFDFLNFSRYYKFEPELCPQYYPRSKGKVEAGVKYLRNNFMSGQVFKKTFRSVDELNEKLSEWLKRSANSRIHATTKQKPSDLWLKEKAILFLIKDYPRYNNLAMQSRWSSQNSMVTYKKNSYWVPPDYARKKIDIEERVENGICKLSLYFKGTKIVEHVKATTFGGWFLPKDYGLKGKKKAAAIEERVISNPLYNVKVDVRDMDYYNNKYIPHYGKKKDL